MSRKKILFVITILLFITPFFWFNPGEMDLGGDGVRLYFYSPISIIKNLAFYNIHPIGQRLIISNHYYIPFLLILSFVKHFIDSPYVLISVINGLKIGGSFLFVYLIVRELLVVSRKEKFTWIAAMFAGFFYILSPSVTENMSFALPTHNQVFLNPLIFYLLLKFFLDNKQIFLWSILLTTIIFSPNFDPYIAAPPLFAFYPIATLFLILYVKIILKKNIALKWLFFCSLLFIGLHTFHIAPDIWGLFSSGSTLNLRVFDRTREMYESAKYFDSVSQYGKLNLNFFYRSPVNIYHWTSFLVPLVIILAFQMNLKKRGSLLLIGLFYLLVLFMMSYHITDFSYNLYKSFYNIPGFGMFRNFVGQWQFVYTFFYALLFGESLGILYAIFNKKLSYVFSFIIIIFFALNSLSFFRGKIINVVHTGTNGVGIAIKMDKRYEDTLNFIHELPDDGKIISFPFSDFSTQVLYGVNKAAYVGPSSISFLTGKSDFLGYNDMMPFSDLFLKIVKEKNYVGIKKLFALLNIKYIFYNSDPRVYDGNFTSYPYNNARNYFPNNQKNYAELIAHFASKAIFKNGPFKIFLFDEKFYLPRLYIPIIVKNYNRYDKTGWYGTAVSFFLDNLNDDARKLFIRNDQCRELNINKICNNDSSFDRNIPEIKYQRINPVKYMIEVSNVKKPYFLVLSDSFDNEWKIYKSSGKIDYDKKTQYYFNGQIKEYQPVNSFFRLSDITETLTLLPIAEKRHVVVNGYANAWYIKPEDFSGEKSYSLVIEMVGQRIFYFASTISFICLVIFVFWGFIIARKYIWSNFV